MVKQKVVKLAKPKAARRLGKSATVPTFKIPPLVKISEVHSTSGERLQWRMSKGSDTEVQVREYPKDGQVVLSYVLHEPVPIAAYFPFKTKAA